MIHALKALGFAGVSETALGAQQVTGACAAALAQDPGGPGHLLGLPHGGGAIRKYHPERLPALTRLVSPLLAHCKLLRAGLRRGAASSSSAPASPRSWRPTATRSCWTWRSPSPTCGAGSSTRGIDPAAQPGGRRTFRARAPRPKAPCTPWTAAWSGGIRGAGLPATTSWPSRASPASQEALEGLDGDGQGLFLELLACEGGCVNGPQAARACGTAAKWLRVLDRFPGRAAGAPGAQRGPGRAAMDAGPGPAAPTVPEDIKRALRMVGKTSPQDELNCGGCGYDDCRSLAHGPAGRPGRSRHVRLAHAQAGHEQGQRPDPGHAQRRGHRRREPGHRRVQPALRRDDGAGQP